MQLLCYIHLGPILGLFEGQVKSSNGLIWIKLISVEKMFSTIHLIRDLSNGQQFLSFEHLGPD